MNEIIHQILWISDVFVNLKMENIFCKYLKKDPVLVQVYLQWKMEHDRLLNVYLVIYPTMKSLNIGKIIPEEKVCLKNYIIFVWMVLQKYRFVPNTIGTQVHTWKLGKKH
jgi:hypothetical protein